MSKSLILYESMTGNTEKVALRFKETFEKNGWGCDAIRVDKHTDVEKLPYNVEEYDLLCVGGPVIESRPSKQINRILFNNPDTMMYRGKNPSPRLKKIRSRMFSGADVSIPAPTKGIVFVTYGGAPPEAEPSIHLLAHLMSYMNIKCIGQFACRGTEPRHASVNYLADRWYQGSTEDAADTIGRYEREPDHPEFASLTKEERALLDEAVKDTLPDPEGTPMPVPGEERPAFLMPRVQRPSDRDLMKAEIFLGEIIEERMPDSSPFLCIG